MIDCQISYLINQQEMVIALKGELRFSASHKLESAFFTMEEQWCKQKLVIDLTEATFIDSTIYGLIVCHALDFKKLAEDQAIVYYDSQDIQKELHTLGINKLCVLKREPSPYHGSLAEFTVILKPDAEQAIQLKEKVQKAHRALTHLTDDPAMQAVVDTIHNQNKGH